MAALDLRFDILYALAARDGREKALFGSYLPEARQALARSQPTNALPELWFELPLKGEPWLDFHALTSREDLQPNMEFSAESTGGYPEVFRWFASQKSVVRQLALSWDIGSGAGNPQQPAIQLLTWNYAPDVVCGFLEATGKANSTDAYRTFFDSLPEGWFPCYTGVFPAREEHFLRVECIPQERLLQEYARDPELLQRHLEQVGLVDAVPSIARRCSQMANTPFKLEFQFDVNSSGRANPTFAASLRFACPPGENGYEFFGQSDATTKLMQSVQEAGLADKRWRLLPDVSFAERLSKNGQSRVLYCYPAFIKIRWREGELLDAKTYLLAGEQC